MKKWIIVLIAVLVVTAGTVTGIMLSRDGNGNNSNNEVGTATIGTIKIPGNDSTTKVIFTHPPELEGKWEKPTISTLTIDISGQITNISGQSVSFDVFFLFDGQSVNYILPQTLGPGQTVKIVMSPMIASGWGKKVLEIKAAIQKPATTAPPATTPPPTSAPPTTTPPATKTPENQVFTSAPKNPKSPEEVAAAFMFSLVEGDYTKFKELASSESLKLFPSREKFEEEMNSQLGKEFRYNFKAVKITKETIEGDVAELDGIFYFKKPTSDYPDATDPSVTFHLVKENGKWKVTEK